MNILFFDDISWDNLLPLTFTRPVSELRTGILTIRAKWEMLLGQSASHLTRDYLSWKFPARPGEDNLLINGALLPDQDILETLLKLTPGEGIGIKERILAVRLPADRTLNFNPAEPGDIRILPWEKNVSLVNFPWQLFQWNGQEIEKDFSLLTRNRKSAALSETNKILHPENIFAEEGVKAEFATINASSGPVYLGKDAEIMEGSLIRGPFTLCEGSTLKMGAKIYGSTTIGPHSKVGGEVNNSVILGYSNKAHDGFLGNAVIGEWCNLGADTNNSNLKNNYAEVRVWNYREEKFIHTGLQFCGLIMGDHSKCGINTMFNTGTVVGVSANVFGAGFPRNFIPSFSWGGAHGITVYALPKALEVAEEVMSRRSVELTEHDKTIFRSVFQMTEKYRR